MLFNDFYEESDRTTRRRWKIVGLVILGIFAYLVFIFAVISNQPTQQEIEQMISKSPNLRELDRFCLDLPKPNNFNYKRKRFGGNSLTSSIGYFYESGLRFSEVKDFYISYFEKEGWKQEELWEEERSALPKLLDYRKGKYHVSIERGNFSDADYSFSCGKDY